MNCTDLLIQDHKSILRAADVLDHMARCVENGETLEREDVETILCFLRVFADDYHEVKEESALFSELLHLRASNAGPLRQLRFEHDQERSLVAALEDALYTKNNADFVHFADRFVALVQTHIDKEERILFDIVERSFSPDQDRKVVAEFDKYQIDLQFLAGLRRLEWKYLRKSAAAAAG